MADAPPPGIFLSYRRADGAVHSHLLAARLNTHFPNAKVFLDVVSIKPGANFVTAIRSAVESSVVVLALIGPEWVARLDENRPDDYVRLELRIALDRGRWVIPVLIGGAPPLDAARLPPELRTLAERQAVELRDDRLQLDGDRLIEAVEDILREPAAPAPATVEGIPPSGNVGAMVSALHPVRKGTSATTDTLHLGEPFDVIVSVRVGTLLSAFVDRHTLRVSIMNLTRATEAARSEITEQLAPLGDTLARDVRVEFGPLRDTSPGDVLRVVAVYEVVAGVYRDYSTVESLTFVAA